jgi:hypothetical protein
VSGKPTRTGRPWALATLLVAMLAIEGCGSGAATTVSVPSHVAGQPQTSVTRTAPHPAAKPALRASGASGAKSGGSPGGETSEAPARTAKGPAFAHQETSSEGLSAALEVLRQRDFTAGDTATYHSNQTLRVLIGSGSSRGSHGQQAFFFEDGRYLGTDTSQPSAAVEVVSQADTEVTLAYPLYRPHDSLCCPTGGRADVRFQLDNGTLQALDPIPPVSSSNAAGRR